MTIREFKQLTKLPIKEANLLVSFVVDKSLTDILIHQDYEFSKSECLKLEKFTKRRLMGEPMAYILGEQEFCGLKFKVDKNVLIPRPETEMLVEGLIPRVKSDKNTKQLIVDTGTGSGCIAIALAHALKRKITAIDISAQALKIAKNNAKLNNVEKLIDFIKGNLLEPLSTLDFTTFDLLVCANLPYLTPSQVKNSPTIQHEPRLAQISGNDGLKHYRELFKQAKKLNAKSITLLCEIDETQKKSMSELIKKELPLAQFGIKKDLGGYDRLAIINL